jgi:DNA repair photolyase
MTPSDRHYSPALRRGPLADPFTYSLYACAPYRGCGHGCAYCDGRAEKYYVEGEFDRDIVIREDLPERLARELPSLREWGPVSLGSGVTDSYQPCEREHRVTRQLAKALSSMPDHRDMGGMGPLPVVILTKSAGILDDLDVWSRVNARSAVLVLVSITSLDEGLRRDFEPGASSFEDRLDVLKRFKAAGCLTGALTMPFLPGINDGIDSMHRLFAALKALRVDFALSGGLTLRPGRQKEHFFRVLQDTRPELMDEHRKIYREERASGAPLRSYQLELMAKINEARRGLELPWMLPHRDLRRLLEPHDELAVLFRQMIELFRGRGVDIKRLSSALTRYEAWLKERRTEFRRHRKLPSNWLSERLRSALTCSELAQVLDNRKLTDFAGRVILDRAILDPLTLRLVDSHEEITPRHSADSQHQLQ